MENEKTAKTLIIIIRSSSRPLLEMDMEYLAYVIRRMHTEAVDEKMQDTGKFVHSDYARKPPKWTRFSKSAQKYTRKYSSAKQGFPRGAARRIP